MYWEQQPLHIHRKIAELAPVIDLADIESLLSSQPVFFPGVQLTQSGKAIDVTSYADDQNRILPLRLFEHYAQGATIILSQAHKLFAPLNDLCREVMRTMTMRCQTNIYLSPPGNQGFNAHYDSHDVFIIQVSGIKTFNFYPSSVELPCPGEPFDSRMLASDVIDESIQLTAGDTLYIPRGVVHDAVADDKAPSIHVTLGVYPVLLRDMLQEAIQILSERDSQFRRSKDSYLAQSKNNGVEPLQDALAALTSEVHRWLDDPDSIRLIQSRFDDELSVGALQDCRGLVMRGPVMRDEPGNAAAEPLPVFDTLRLRQGSLINHELHPDGLKIRTFGQMLEFSEPIAGVVVNLLDNGELRKDELATLRPEQRDAVVKRLLQANLVDFIQDR